MTSPLPDIDPDKKPIFMDQAPGPTKAVLKLIAESKVRELKPYEVKAYERTLASLSGFIKTSDTNENIKDLNLLSLKARKEALYIHSKKLDKTLIMMKNGGDMAAVDIVRQTIDGEVVEDK